ncbi:hypothetical protein CMI37_31850 [Candidatus Pacearchaeota archaeon]|nr:hypothetical protein [Candidatus Pacearchaeota archaeon]|tara:strand:- start:1252 stop:2838 length:1587 start_codon:yes stop_codon:yes gene_type:complete
MKVLLLVPTFHYKGHTATYLSVSDFPTGLAYLASALKKAGHEVIGLNLNNSTRYKSAYVMIANGIHETLEKEKPDLIGLGGLCTDYAFIKDAIGVIRRYTKAPIVMGGGIINNDKEFVFNLLKPDFCIWGEAEEAIVKLADTLEKEEHPGDIDNLAYWTESGAIFNQTNYDYGDLDDRAFPDYEPFGVKEMLNEFSLSTRVLYKYSRSHPRPMTINTARSCPFNCSFCVHQGGPKYRARSIPNIMEEIRRLYRKYKFNILIIGDELFAVNKKRMREFCVALIEEREEYGWDFDWMFQTHPNAKLDKETLELAKKAGCYFFSYGLESASQKVLQSMNKKTRPAQYVETIALAKEVGMGFGGNLLFGDPVETEETILETLDFFAQHCQQSLIFLAMLAPYPGCKIFDYCVEKGIIQDKERYYESIGDVTYNMTEMSDEQFAKWMTFLMTLEGTWMMATSVDSTKVIEERRNGKVLLGNGRHVYQVFATCTFCGEESMYREIWSRESPVLYLGTGCQHCHKKIKIHIKGGI